MSVPQIDVSVLRRQLFNVLDRLPTDGPIDVLRHGQIVARIDRPPPELRTAKPEIDPRRLARLCRKHRICRLALFGSVLREDFGSDSDIDVLVDYAPGVKLTLHAAVSAHEDFVALFGRSVDLVDRHQLQDGSPRSRTILESARVIYET